MGRRSSRKFALDFADCEVSSNADFLQSARGGQKIKRRRVPIRSQPIRVVFIWRCAHNVVVFCARMW